MKSITFKTGILAATILIGILTSIHPIYPKEQLLQHAGTALLLAILVIDIRRNNLTMTSFACVSMFAIIHIVGARYIYSFVPYRDWFLTWFHFDINGLFHTDRNHYDRFVHLMFGILAFPYLLQIMRSNKIHGMVLRIIVVWCFIQAFSMIYEIFEWSLTLYMSPETADSYNGQQGDIWDAQKDMFLAMVGSTIMALVYAFKKRH